MVPQLWVKFSLLTIRNVCYSGLIFTVLDTWSLVKTRVEPLRNWWLSGNTTELRLLQTGLQVVRTVLTSYNSNARSLSLMASVRQSQYSHPRIISAARGPTILKLAISTRLRTYTERLMVPIVYTMRILASRTLTFCECLIIFHVWVLMETLKMKLDPAPVSKKTTSRTIARPVKPILAYILNFVLPYRW